jgi:hypothetical protein
MRERRSLLCGLCVLAALALAAPASAEVLGIGIDVWTTPDDGSAYVDFTDNPIAADYFCGGSQQFAQRIILKGSPIATSPSRALGSTDTIVKRLDNVDLGGGSGSTRIQVQAISFVNKSPISVPGCSDTFSAQVTLNGTAPVGNMTIRRTTASGGTFDSNFSVPGKITFTNNRTLEQFKVPVTETVTLQTSGAPWAETVGSGGISYPNPVSIDIDGNGSPDVETPGTTAGFAPGWWDPCSVTPCPAPKKVDHNGPHPTWPLPPPPPPPPCPKHIFDAVVQFEAEQAAANTTPDSVTGSGGTATPVEDEVGETEAVVRSSTQYAGENLTVVQADSTVVHCVASTRTATHFVAVE